MESLPTEVPKLTRKYAPRVRVPNPLGRYHGEDPYLHKPFIGWDGEGVTLEDGSHSYTLMVNSLGNYVQGSARKPLTTRQCVRFLLDGVAKAPASAIHVIFGGGYDTNMMLGGLTREEIQAIHSEDWVTTRGLRLAYRQGKSFYVRDEKTLEAIQLYDVISFFQCSFVKACDSYLGESWPDREMIIRMKAARGIAFEGSTAKDVRAYSFSEVNTLVLLMQELRSRLYRAGMKITRWDGPGAVASVLLKNRSVKQFQNKEIPNEVAQAARFAYAGGRFELIKCGHVETPVYEYDINSAYPAGLSHLPRIDQGQWKRIEPRAHHGFSAFGLYRLQWESDGRDIHLPNALPLRGSNGSVWFPWQGSGWYYGIEARQAQLFHKRFGNAFQVLDGYEWEPVDDYRPFHFIPEMYEQRRRLKDRGDGAHVGMKLGLNSLYGKLCQQVGWKLGPKGLRIPPYHQLEWAGFATSYTRSRIMEAILLDPAAIIAIETDAVFSTKKLKLDIGPGLGQWTETVFENMTYVQSGFYFAKEKGGKEIARYRGFDPGTVTREMVLDSLQSYGKLKSQTTRFIGMGAALAGNFDRWRRWETQERVLTPYPLGKREHSEPCEACGPPSKKKYLPTFTLGVWHLTECPMAFTMQESHEYPVGWINPNPKMSMLEEMRLEGYGQWEDMD